MYNKTYKKTFSRLHSWYSVRRTNRSISSNSFCISSFIFISVNLYQNNSATHSSMTLIVRPFATLLLSLVAILVISLMSIDRTRQKAFPSVLEYNFECFTTTIDEVVLSTAAINSHDHICNLHITTHQSHQQIITLIDTDNFKRTVVPNIYCNNTFSLQYNPYIHRSQILKCNCL